MLPAALVLEIRRLLDEGGLSQRAIAARLNVSRGTVGNIACGRRGLHGAVENDVPDWREGPQLARRCRGCGGRVYEPCLLCQARAYRRRFEEIRWLVRDVSPYLKARHVA